MTRAPTIGELVAVIDAPDTDDIDIVEPVPGVELVFDGCVLGQLLMATVRRSAAAGSEGWMRFASTLQGPTLWRLYQENDHAVEEPTGLPALEGRVTLDPAEWATLRNVVWTGLHQSIRPGLLPARGVLPVQPAPPPPGRWLWWRRCHAAFPRRLRNCNPEPTSPFPSRSHAPTGSGPPATWPRTTRPSSSGAPWRALGRRLLDPESASALCRAVARSVRRRRGGWLSQQDEAELRDAALGAMWEALDDMTTRVRAGRLYFDELMKCRKYLIIRATTLLQDEARPKELPDQPHLELAAQSEASALRTGRASNWRAAPSRWLTP